MTVLHLSSQWPAGLAILLAAGAVGIINKTFQSNYFSRPVTAVDLATHFNCCEAVRVLFDAGCAWNEFNVHSSNRISLDCVRVIAQGLADRRRRLGLLAKATLTEDQLAATGCPAELLDSHAANVVRLLGEIGVHVPTTLAVPDDYEGIYLSGNLVIGCFPAFFDAGFCDVNHNGRDGSLAMQMITEGAKEEPGDDYATTFLLAPGVFSWLKQHDFLDKSPSDPLGLGVNTAATGWHFLPLLTSRTLLWDIYFQGARYSDIYQEILTKQLADSCRCLCSSSGCLPFTTVFKSFTQEGGVTFFLGSLDLCRAHTIWETFQGNLLPELLRYFTFEALEMTHTCCFERWLPWKGEDSMILTLRNFRGSVNGIHDEESELITRLESLVSEFATRFRKSEEELGDFMWGYWRRRMGEECVPIHDEGTEAMAAETGIRLQRDCESLSFMRCDNERKPTYVLADETPYSLKVLFGEDFDLRYDDPSSLRGIDSFDEG